MTVSMEYVGADMQTTVSNIASDTTTKNNIIEKQLPIILLLVLSFATLVIVTICIKMFIDIIFVCEKTEGPT